MENERLNKVKIYCNSCGRETNHDVKSTHEQSYEEIYDNCGQKFLSYYENTQYGFLVCRGCDTATLEEQWTCSGMYENEEQVYAYDYHPKRKNLGGRQAKRFHHVDKKLDDTYKEIITAFQQGLAIVTAMGVRALLEGVCVLEGIDDQVTRSLAKKIEKLKEVSNMPNGIIDGLNSLKFIGDDAAHRLSVADKDTLSLSIDLLESLLNHMYEARGELERKAEMIKKIRKGDGRDKN
jgi:hypothetical protein